VLYFGVHNSDQQQHAYPSAPAGKDLSRSIILEQDDTGWVILLLQRPGGHRQSPLSPGLPSHEPAATWAHHKRGFKREHHGVLLLFKQRHGYTELAEVFPSSRSAPMVRILAAEFVGSSHPTATRAGAMLLLP